MTKLLSPLISSTYADLFQVYPNGIGVYLPMILSFGVKLGYQNSFDALTLSNNPASTLKEPEVQNNKLTEDLVIEKIVEVEKLTFSFISFPIELVPKHNRK